MEIDFEVLIPKFDAILERGLCSGLGQRNGQMCIEAAICAALDLPHGDYPACVSPAIRSFKITLNDSPWSSAEARAKGLRDLGIAQIGSLGVIDDQEFTKRISERTIRVLIPALFRDVFDSNPLCLAAADCCENEGTIESARAATAAARAAGVAGAGAAADAAWAAGVAGAGAAAGVAWAAAGVAGVAGVGDKYFILSASIALEVLRELKSPGCEWV